MWRYLTAGMFAFGGAYVSPALADLEIAEAQAPQINCLFADECRVTVQDTVDDSVDIGGRSPGRLQSRTYRAQAGTPLEGHLGYSYRLDLRDVESPGDLPPCVTQLSLPFAGPVAKADYDGDGAADDDLYVVTRGGIGSVKVERAFFRGDQLVMEFEGYGVCAGLQEGGDSSFFFGFASMMEPTPTEGLAMLNGGGVVKVDLRVPRGGPNALPPTDGQPNAVDALTFRVAPPDAQAPFMMAQGFGGEERPVAVLIDESQGATHYFVENELILATDDMAERDRFLDAFKGEVIAEFDPEKLGGVGAREHLVRVSPQPIPPSDVTDVWVDLAEGVTGTFSVSRQESLGLLSLIAQARADGYVVSANMMLAPDDLRNGSTAEAVNNANSLLDPAGAPIPYDRDAASWPYMARGATQDIGVDSAWSMLARSERLDANVKIAVIDAGFATTADLPPHRMTTLEGIHPASDRAQPSCPRPCRHGAQVANVLMGIPNNNLGGAGPAGPVVEEATFIYFFFDSFSFRLALNEAVAYDADIINMSFGALGSRLPMEVSDRIADTDRMLRGIRDGGTLIFAAAGNSGADLDSDGLFAGGPRRLTSYPCERGGVICVGGLQTETERRNPGSNFGSSVDIFGPFSTYVGPFSFAAAPCPPPGPSTPPCSPPLAGVDEDMVSVVNGTSFASPFVAGVAALIWSANRDLTADEVEDILISTAHDSPDPQVSRIVNAHGAMLAALRRDAVTELSLDIVRPRDGAVTFAGAASLGLEARAFDLQTTTPDVRWTSDREGEIGRGLSAAHVFRIPGRHRVTATIRGANGETLTDSVEVNVDLQAPFVDISSPSEASRFATNQNIPLEVRSYDYLNSAPLAPPALSWFIGDATTPFANGARAVIPAATLSVGPAQIRVIGRSGSTVSEDTVMVFIDEPTDDARPSVAIVAPEPGAAIYGERVSASDAYQATFMFEAIANDTEDGPLSSTVSWSACALPCTGSSTILGRGRRISADLRSDGGSPQRYQITATVRDSSGNISTSTTEVLVNVLI